MSKNLIGRVLQNRFRVDAFLASGGMGAVYRVWDLQRNVPLAMKILNADLADDEHILKLFEREARALQRLGHPHIVSFYGLYKTPGFIFLLEQFVDGPSLKEILKYQGNKPLSVTEALTYLNAVASALAYAHANGVVHCDIKPGNVLIDRGGGIYLADFGIARHADSTTTTMATLGTAAYMAPEQIRGEPVGSETDVYALGVMLFEMLTGQRPFKGNEIKDDASGATANERIRASHLRAPVPEIHHINPALPVALSAVIKKSMAKTRSERYSGPLEMLSAVNGAFGIADGQVPARVSLSEHFYEAGHEPASVAAPVRNNPPAALWIVGALLLLFLGVFAFSGVGSQNPVTYSDPASGSTGSFVNTSRPANTLRPTNTPRLVATTRPATQTPRPTMPPTATAFACPGAPYKARFVIGERLKVCTKQDSLMLRRNPGRDREILEKLAPGTELIVVGGPRCADNVVWWKVEVPSLSANDGWVMDGTDPIDKRFLCKAP